MLAPCSWRGYRSQYEYSPHALERVQVHGQILATCFSEGICPWMGKYLHHIFQRVFVSRRRIHLKSSKYSGEQTGIYIPVSVPAHKTRNNGWRSFFYRYVKFEGCTWYGPRDRDADSAFLAMLWSPTQGAWNIPGIPYTINYYYYIIVA